MDKITSSSIRFLFTDKYNNKIMKKFTTFYKAFKFLEWHPYYAHPHEERLGFEYSLFQQCLDLMVVKVNPETDSIDDDESKNTKTQIWIETGYPYLDENQCWFAYPRTNVHDYELDCGGDTYEEAIIELANLVLKEYGTHDDFDADTFIKIKEEEESNSYTLEYWINLLENINKQEENDRNKRIAKYVKNRILKYYRRK